LVTGLARPSARAPMRLPTAVEPVKVNLVDLVIGH
jgi:hypothetical protein